MGKGDKQIAFRIQDQFFHGRQISVNLIDGLLPLLLICRPIGLGPVAPLPFRAKEAERWLAGKPATVETAKRAATLAQEEARPRTSLLRCSREYRQAMVGVLVQSTLEQAIAAATETSRSAP